MTKKFWLASILIAGAIVCLGAAEWTGAYDSRDVSRHNAKKVLHYLQPIAESSGKAIRLYYRGLPCRSHKNEAPYAPVPFPVVQVQAPSKGKTGLAAVQEIFANDKNVTVTEEPIEIIRVRIGEVPTAILQTKMSHLRFRKDAQFNQWVAVEAIVDAKEVKAAAHRLGVSPVSGSGGLVGGPEEAAPHLPASLTNVTVDQALDLIAKTFSSVVTYGACSEAANLDGTKPFVVH